MMDNRYQLNVWYKTSLVGIITRDSIDRMGFEYTTEWVASGFPLSQQLPLSIQNYSSSDGIAHRFFANLLPEADARQSIVRDLKISDTDFALLKAVGGECAGAFSILSSEIPIDLSLSYTEITDELRRKILVTRGAIRVFPGDNSSPRLSLAGAQNKFTLLVKGEHYYIPNAYSPSTHIIKFPVKDYKNVPAYECFLSRLARNIGLPAVPCDFRTFEKMDHLLIPRYDRLQDADFEIKRLHQEDFCQALGYSSNNKYENEGGPSFQACYALLQRVSTNPIQDADNLIKWQIFNVLGGNSDGHAKNIALLYDLNQQTRLAPFYDLVPTRAIERLDERLAFAVGGEYVPGDLLPKHWTAFAKECGVNPDYVHTTLKTLSGDLLSCLEGVRDQFEDDHGPHPELQRVMSVIKKQCTRVLKSYDAPS